MGTVSHLSRFGQVASFSGDHCQAVAIVNRSTDRALAAVKSAWPDGARSCCLERGTLSGNETDETPSPSRSRDSRGLPCDGLSGNETNETPLSNRHGPNGARSCCLERGTLSGDETDETPSPSRSRDSRSLPCDGVSGNETDETPSPVVAHGLLGFAV